MPPQDFAQLDLAITSLAATPGNPRFADLFTDTGGRSVAPKTAFAQLQAETEMLCNLYARLQKQVAGSCLYELHLLFRKHGNEQRLASAALAAHAGGEVLSVSPPLDGRVNLPLRGRQGLPARIERLLELHESILTLAHRVADDADLRGDRATRKLIVGSVVRPNEFQVWCLLEQMANLNRFSA